MCTVSIISTAGRVRLASNRDERRNRAPALAPREVSSGRTRALMPIDPESGGTWIAASDAGLAIALLNVTPDPPAASAAGPLRSRGGIIPQLLHLRRVEEVAEAALAIDWQAYGGFRLVVSDRERAAEVVPSAGAATWHDLSAPVMFTSSGLGDHLVQQPRAALFARLTRRASSLAAAQDRFHAHRWRTRPEISVRMSRTDATTVSTTVVLIGAGKVSMRYRALMEGAAAAATRAAISAC
jgi:uncharacterized protein with NRDE domain